LRLLIRKSEGWWKTMLRQVRSNQSRLLFWVISTLLVAVEPAFCGGISWVASFDEKGSGFYYHYGKPQLKVPLSFAIFVDPFNLLPPLPAFGPMFSLTPGVSRVGNFTEKITVGDLVILEPNTNTIADLVRFETIKGLPGDKNGGANALFFYSDSDGDKDVSDLYQVLPFLVNPVVVTETKSGTYSYNPTPKQPGGLATAKPGSLDCCPYQYIIQSDCSSDGSCSPPVPEPFMLPALATTVIGILGYGRRRRKLMFLS